MKSRPDIYSSKGNLAACLQRMAWGYGFRNAILGQSGDVPEYGRELLNVIETFERINEGYALAGAVAAMYYGRARFTDELEFVTSGKFIASLRIQFGRAVRFLEDSNSEGIIARARPIEFDGHQIKIADPHDLIAMKLRGGKLEDDYDISQIVQNTAIDDSIVQQRVTPEQYARYLELKQRN